MRRVVLLALLLMCGCNEPESSTIEVGQHRFAVQVPQGWEHIDYGRAQHFKNGMAKIAMEDMGARSLDFDEALPHVLEKLGYDRQRDIASRKTVLVNGHEFRVIDTWDRLSHDHRKRFAFAYQGNQMLVLYTNFGQFQEMETAFETILNSIEFREPAAAASAPQGT